MLEVIARAIIVVEDRVLLARADGAANTFLPGGHVEAGESITSALRREVREELGMECRIGAAAGVVEHRWLDGANERFEINHVFVAHLPSVDVSSREPGIAFSWCGLADLDDANVQPAPMRAIARFVAAGPAGVREAARIHESTFAAAAPCEVRHVRADDVERLRSARLYALAETPVAFGATLARDLAMTDERWRAWAEERPWNADDARTRATFVADDGDALRGTITVVRGRDGGASPPAHRDASAKRSASLGREETGTALVLAMWVHASQRGAATAARLLHEALRWAREQACTRASLHVTTARARRFYEREGFVATGHTTPLAHTPAVLEHEMVCTRQSG